MKPLVSDAGLEGLSGLNELLKQFGRSDVVVLGAAAGRTVITASRIGKGREGALVAFGFDQSFQDYVGNPVTVNYIKRNNAGAVLSIGDLVLGPYSTQQGTPQSPLPIPTGYPLWIPPDTDVGIVVNGTVDVAGNVCRASIYGVTWSETDSRTVRHALWGRAGRTGHGSPWPKGLMT
jgi:hypothetical protein